MLGISVLTSFFIKGRVERYILITRETWKIKKNSTTREGMPLFSRHMGTSVYIRACVMGIPTLDRDRAKKIPIAGP